MMPIRPENLARYPRDWPAISLRIRKERAGDRCECHGECGHDHGGRCPEINGEPHSITGSTVILTVAHLDDTPEHCADDNLRAMCQRCHLAYDRDIHIANLRETHSRRRLVAANNLELFGEGSLGVPTRPERGPIPLPPAPASIGAWPFGNLRPRQYGAILADPPWRFSNFSGKGEAKNPVAHYPCMKLEDLARLPVASLAAPDCALITWATAPLLDRAIELVKAWGFNFKSAGTWAKRSSTGSAWAFGTGYVFRSAAEFYIVATVGKPKVQSRAIRNLIVAPTREHSRKPDQMHADIEALYAGPYAELFARQRRPGWDCWGNDVDLFPEAAE
jgi:N6-adenosine-specific RNA methylase IME4